MQSATFTPAFALASLLACAGAAAQNDSTPPRPVSQPLPPLPTDQLQMPLEGWIIVRYSVLADGRTDNVRAVETMPAQMSPNDSLAALADWIFEPATFEGEPIDWHNNESILVFDHPDVPPEASELFSSAYSEIDQLIAASEFEDALERNELLLRNRTFRLTEIVLAHVQAAVVNMRTGDLQSAYEAIVRATRPGVGDALSSDALDTALQYRYALEMQIGDVMGAFQTYERMEAIAPIPADDARAEQAKAVREALQTGAPIGVEGRLGREPWGYELDRRIFTFAEIEGAISAIHVECDRRTTTLEFSELVEWNLPQSWGSCVIAIDGRPGTEFVLMQFE